MRHLAQIHNRDIKYVEFDTARNWIENFPNKNWCIVIIADDENERYFSEIIRKSIDRNVIWISSAGMQHELIHEMADEELLIRDVEDNYLPDHLVITIGEENLEVGIFNGIFLPIQAEENLKEIILLDVNKFSFEKINTVVQELKMKYT